MTTPISWIRTTGKSPPPTLPRPIAQRNPWPDRTARHTVMSPARLGQT